MSKVRNISGGPRYVPLLGRTVEDGEVAEVPDFQPAHTDGNPLPIVWPEATWEEVPDGDPGTVTIALDSQDPHFATADDTSHEGI